MSLWSCYDAITLTWLLVILTDNVHVNETCSSEATVHGQCAKRHESQSEHKKQILWRLFLLEKPPVPQLTQKLPTILWNPKIQHRVHKSPLLVPNLKQMTAVHIITSYLSKFHFNTILPLTSRSSWWFLSFWLSHQNPVCIPLFPHARCMPCQSYPPGLDNSNYVWRRVQVTEFIIMQHSPASC
jgi:hypothetical protein